MTPQELIAYIEGLIIDNTTQQVTPYKMRAVLTEIVNSLNQSNISSLSAVLPLEYDPFTNTLSLPVINNLTAGGTNSVLSAEQGKVLKQLIDDLVISGGIPEAPIDGTTYGRKDGEWEAVVAGTTPTLQQVTDELLNSGGESETTNPINVPALILQGSLGKMKIIADAGQCEIYDNVGNLMGYINNQQFLFGDNNAENFVQFNAPTSGQSILIAPETPPSTSETIATEEYVDAEISAAVAGLLDLRGNYDASSNAFPSSGGSGTAGAILKGDFWYISVAGTLNGQAVNIGDSIYALNDAPSSSQWEILQANLTYVPEDTANKSTSMSGNETSDDKYLSAKAIANELALKSDKTSLQFIRQTTDSSSTSTTKVNTDISFSVEANSEYKIQGFIYGGCNSSGGMRIGWTLPSGCSGTHAIIAFNNNTPANAIPSGIGSDLTAFAFSSNIQQSRYEATLITGSNGGTITLGFGSTTAGQTSIFRTNSNFIILK